MTESPLLCLVMMVKNEARGIEETLLSVKDIVDRILILDTGSTDDTIVIIQNVMGEHGLQGHIAFEEFVNYADTRNRALELADDLGCTFSLMLSGDEELIDAQGLRDFLEKKQFSQSPFDEAFYMNVSLGCIYPSTRITRRASGWQYHGVTHEYMSKMGHPLPVHLAPGLIVHHYERRTEEENREKWKRDKSLLHREHEKNPLDARTVFYLAQTYRCLGDRERARVYYQKRADMGGWPAEVYEALYNVAEITGQDEDYLKAYAASPHRVEPLVKLAEKWANHPMVSYLFATRACELDFPSIGQYVFLDEDAYHYRRWDLLGRSAWYTGHFEEGKEAVEEALRKKPGEPHLLRNLAFYTDHEKDET